MRENIRAVTAYAASITASADLAEEAVQETFIRAWRYSSSYRGDAPVISWLISICRRVVIDLSQRQSLNTHLALPDDVVAHDDPFTISDIQELAQQLPLHYREVFILCVVLGFDYESAAHVLEVPIGTVRSRLARARESLTTEIRKSIAV